MTRSKLGTDCEPSQRDRRIIGVKVVCLKGGDRFRQLYALVLLMLHFVLTRKPDLRPRKLFQGSNSGRVVKVPMAQKDLFDIMRVKPGTPDAVQR